MNLKHPYGYACINLTLQSQGITTNRSLIQKTLKAKGLPYVAELAMANVLDLKTIVKWNIANGLQLFRITSDIFPWWSEYELTQLPNYKQLRSILEEIGSICLEYNHRVSFHPDHFNKMASPNPDIVRKSIRDIEQHSLIFDMMGFKPSHFNKINIHVGGAYGDKISAMARFCDNFALLSPNAQKRLTVENDDKSAMFSVKELYQNVYSKIGIPIVFDYHHHSIYPDNQTQKEAFDMAYSTWIDSIPTFHYSESGENGIRSHSEYISCNQINLYDVDVQIIIEAKAKDLAVLNFIKRIS